MGHMRINPTKLISYLHYLIFPSKDQPRQIFKKRAAWRVPPKTIINPPYPLSHRHSPVFSIATYFTVTSKSGKLLLIISFTLDRKSTRLNSSHSSISYP